MAEQSLPALSGTCAPETAPWRSILESSPESRIDLESAIGSFFVGDAEFTRAVVDTIEKILSCGDMHKWAELKRLDAHAAKHQRIASDHLLNLTCLLINRICCLNGPTSCELYRDIVYDRLENFHNQCRDEIPQSVSRFRAKFEYLHSYNVKSYQSILQLVGTFVLKAKSELANELGKRIASNHNHWFNFVHMIEFIRSLIDGIQHPVAGELLLSLGPDFFRVISGLCGRRLGHPSIETTILESSGVRLSSSIVADGWIGSLLIDVLDLCRRSAQVFSQSVLFSGLIASVLNTLASLDTTLDRPLIINTVISMIPDLVASGNVDSIASEAINFLLCNVMKCPISDWDRINLESCNVFLLRLAASHSKQTERLRSLLLKWIRAMVLGPLSHPGIVYTWKSLVALDSPVMSFVIDSIGPQHVAPQPVGEPVKPPTYSLERAITCFNAVELIRAILVRDIVVAKQLAFNQSTSGLDALTVPRKSGDFDRTCGLAIIANEAFQLRRCRKSCAFILHQCVIRNARLVFQVLSESQISQNIARMILDVKFEEEMDLFSLVSDFDEIDFDHLNDCEKCNLDNHSIHSLISVNSLLEMKFFYDLESFVERMDNPVIVNDRLEHWLVHNNPLAAITDLPGVVYHYVSARFMALALLYESSGSMTSILLGLLETSVGVINDDLNKELVGIDALFLLLNIEPPEESFEAHFEYLMALRVVNELLDNAETRNAVLRFIQYRWEHRFSIMKSLVKSSASLVKILEMNEFFKIASIELLVANQLVDSDAQHVANMREFGNTFIAADVSRGSFSLLKFVVDAANDDLVNMEVCDIKDPRIDNTSDNLLIMKSQGVIELVDSFVGVICQWSETFADRANVIQNMIESVSVEGEFIKLCWFSRIVPKLLLLANGSSDSLAFNLRMLKSLVAEYPTTDDSATKAGLVESIALCLVGFAGTKEVWMIDKDSALLRALVEISFSFLGEIVRGQNGFKNSALLLLNVVLSFIATERQAGRINPAVDVVKGVMVAKPMGKIEDKQLDILMNEFKNLVDNDILFRELGI